MSAEPERGEVDFKFETELLKKKGLLDDRKCGVCGGKAELGPFCGGPYGYYCKACHRIYMKIVGDYVAHVERAGFAIYHKRRFFKKSQTNNQKNETKKATHEV